MKTRTDMEYISETMPTSMHTRRVCSVHSLPGHAWMQPRSLEGYQTAHTIDVLRNGHATRLKNDVHAMKHQLEKGKSEALPWSGS